MTDRGQEGPPRALLITAIAVAIAAIAAVLAIAAIRQPPQRQQVPIAAVPAPRADSSGCRALLAALAGALGYERPGTLLFGAGLAERSHRGGRSFDDPLETGDVDLLPEDLGDYHRVPAAEPAPQGAAAWQAAPDAEPVILRCGLDRPAEFVVGAPVQVVDAVQWFEVADSAVGRSTWFAVDRPVYVALTLPQGSGPTPIQQISDVIATTLPATEIDPAPAR